MLEQDTKRVCSQCLREDAALCLAISNDQNSHQPCDYCKSGNPTMSMFALGNMTDWLIENYYVPEYFNEQTEEIDGAPLQDVLEDEVSDNPGVIEDLVFILTDCWFERSSHQRKYGEEPHFSPAISTSGKLSRNWESMEQNLRENNRFFNQEAFKTFEDVFGYLLNNHPSAFIELTPEIPLYRARIFKSQKDIAAALRKPEESLGPPPSELAPAGRMNARGISVFYGATSPVNAISEVRPPVGSFVVVSEFRLLKSVHLLDLNMLAKLGVNGVSRFNPLYLQRYELTSFLKTLSSKLVMPVVPELAESNYLLTQAIADYLSITPCYALDGIMFSSAQKPLGKNDNPANNVILFHRSSRVKNAYLRNKEADVEMFEPDGQETNFDPWMTTTDKDFQQEFAALSNRKSGIDVLELNLDSIEIHEVTGVSFNTTVTPVYHHRKESAG